jgi:DNA primase
MAGRIPQSTIDEIRRRVEIVEVVSDYVSLKWAGKGFKGLRSTPRRRRPSR